MLTSEHKVTCEKIGVSNFYWAFPSQATQTRRLRQAQLQTQLTALQQKQADLKQRRKRATTDRQESDQRKQKLARLAELRQKSAAIDTQLSGFAKSDPQRIAALQKGTAVCFDSANRWTDNIEVALSSFEKKFGHSKSDLRKNLQLPELDELPEEMKGPQPNKKQKK